MDIQKICRFYSRPESLHIGRGLGCCDLDSVSVICEGDIAFCEKFEIPSNFRAREEEKQITLFIQKEEVC